MSANIDNSGLWSARFLVVDDEEKVRSLLREVLELQGYEVATACNGAEALEKLSSDVFDGIFTDIGMPGMSGWELIRRIRERGDTTRLAVITGWGETVSPVEHRAAGIEWVVTKPFTLECIENIALVIATTTPKRQLISP